MRRFKLVFKLVFDLVSCVVGAMSPPTDKNGYVTVPCACHGEVGHHISKSWAFRDF
jgi:hypothetical protein